MLSICSYHGFLLAGGFNELQTAHNIPTKNEMTRTVTQFSENQEGNEKFFEKSKEFIIITAKITNPTSTNANFVTDWLLSEKNPTRIMKISRTESPIPNLGKICEKKDETKPNCRAISPTAIAITPLTVLLFSNNLICESIPKTIALEGSTLNLSLYILYIFFISSSSIAKDVNISPYPA